MAELFDKLSCIGRNVGWMKPMGERWRRVTSDDDYDHCWLRLLTTARHFDHKHFEATVLPKDRRP